MRISWEQWQASREAKREVLRRAGLDSPSRRKDGFGSSDRKLRKAFDGERIPAFAQKKTGRQ